MPDFGNDDLLSAINPLCQDVRDGMCETYYGRQAASELFERTVWHAAQHLRQVYVMLETLGITSDRPLTEADYKGLPLPESIW